jgi:hypothetical protein
MMKYGIFGPFEITRRNRQIHRKDLPEFWQTIDKHNENFISRACGCYLFAICASGGIRPWYVGLAEKKSFSNECFNDRNMVNYNEVLAGRKKGIPMMFFIVRLTDSGRFSKPSKNGYYDCQHLEGLLIGAAWKKNSELTNIKKTKHAKDLCVPGLINTPRGAKKSKSVREFMKVINNS